MKRVFRLQGKGKVEREQSAVSLQPSAFSHEQ